MLNFVLLKIFKDSINVGVIFKDFFFLFIKLKINYFVIDSSSSVCELYFKIKKYIVEMFFKSNCII